MEMLVGSFVGWLVSSLAGWLASRLGGWVAEWLVGNHLLIRDLWSYGICL
jgi:hypothetical protein